MKKVNYEISVAPQIRAEVSYLKKLKLKNLALIKNCLYDRKPRPRHIKGFNSRVYMFQEYNRMNLQDLLYLSIAQAFPIPEDDKLI